MMMYKFVGINSLYVKSSECISKILIINLNKSTYQHISDGCSHVKVTCEYSSVGRGSVYSIRHSKCRTTFSTKSSKVHAAIDDTSLTDIGTREP